MRVLTCTERDNTSHTALRLPGRRSSLPSPEPPSHPPALVPPGNVTIAPWHRWWDVQGLGCGSARTPRPWLISRLRCATRRGCGSKAMDSFSSFPQETPLRWLSIIPLNTSGCQQRISIKFVRAIMFLQAGMCVRARGSTQVREQQTNSNFHPSGSSATCGSFLQRKGAGKSRHPARWDFGGSWNAVEQARGSARADLFLRWLRREGNA